MKLRVRISGETIKVDLQGQDPTLADLCDLLKQTVLPAYGLGLDSDFKLSLNGSDLLSDSAHTLTSCGIVSGDLVCVLLAQPLPVATTTSEAAGTTPSNTSSQMEQLHVPQLTEAQMTHHQPDFNPVWEPMLCSESGEGQAPLSLELLYRSARVSSPNDAIVVAAHLLMLETGFTPQGGELKPEEMPALWRSAAGVYKLDYAHQLCGTSWFSVVAVSMGPLLVINVTLKVTETIDAVRKLQLNASSYVTDEWPEGSSAAAFKNLKKLSQVFKDHLAYPLIAAAREAMALPVAFGLSALPPELLLRVLRLLDVGSVVRLSVVSRHFSAATADAALWRHMYRRDFTASSDSGLSRSRDVDWRELYKKSYKARSDHRRAARRCVPPFMFPDIITPGPRPLFPPLPGIIGGEYDQRLNLPPRLLPHPRYDPIGPIADPAGRPSAYLRRPTGRPPGPDVRRGFI